MAMRPKSTPTEQVSHGIERCPLRRPNSLEGHGGNGGISCSIHGEGCGYHWPIAGVVIVIYIGSGPVLSIGLYRMKSARCLRTRRISSIDKHSLCSETGPSLRNFHDAVQAQDTETGEWICSEVMILMKASHMSQLNNSMCYCRLLF